MSNSKNHIYIHIRIKGKGTVECDKSFEIVDVEKLMNGFFDKNNTDKKIVESLILEDKIEKDLEQFPRSFPKEAILLKSKYIFWVRQLGRIGL